MNTPGIEETWRADAAEQRVCELQHENAELRGAMARMCRAVSRRMMPDDPTPEDRMELREAFDAASEFLHNAGGMARELAAQDSESPTNVNG